MSLASSTKTRDIAVPEDAPNDVETLRDIAASGDSGVNLGDLTEDEFFSHFGLKH